MGVTETAIRNAILQGRLPSERIYGRKVVATKEIEAYRLRTQPEGVKATGRPKGTSDSKSDVAEDAG